MPASAHQPQPPLRLVLDTNIVVAGLLWNGPPRRLIEWAIEGEAVELFSSPVLLDELAHTLGYAKFAGRIDAFGTSIDALAAQYTALVSLVMPARSGSGLPFPIAFYPRAATPPVSRFASCSRLQPQLQLCRQRL